MYKVWFYYKTAKLVTEINYLKLVRLQKAPSCRLPSGMRITIVTPPSTFGSGSFGNDARLAKATDSNSYFHYMT
jgi:hypothetical protein